MTTKAENNEFGTAFLEQIVKWIEQHLAPEEVFEEDALKDWALFNDWCPQDELDQWAEENGYIKAE